MFERPRPQNCPGPASPDVGRNAAVVALYFAAAVLVLAFNLPAIGQTQADETSLIHFGDLIDVDVVGSFEFDWRGKLNPEGFLDGLNTYGDPVYGLCRSESDLSASIAKAFSKMLRDPQIVVRIVDRSDRAQVTLDGAVRTPQRFQLRRAASLRELLIMSGGISDDASGEIQIFRPRNLNCSETAPEPSSGGPKPVAAPSDIPITVIKIADILKGVPEADPAIKSGDLISVLRAVPIYMIGGVNDPRPVLSKPGLTVSRAVAMAGGPSKEADIARVTIYRHDRNVPIVIEADLTKIAAGTLPDTELRPYDIVEVAQKNSAKRKYAPVVQTSTPLRSTVLPLRIVD